MVTLDPCTRLETIFNQLVPSILVGVKGEADIRSIIETYLPKLESSSYRLSEQCTRERPQCGDTCQLCEEGTIKEFFDDTREQLRKIWSKVHINEEIPEETCVSIFNI